jgi:uncharacterized membrane protein YgcG
MKLLRLITALAMCCACASGRAGDYTAKTTTRFPIPERYTLVNDYIPMLRLSSRSVVMKKLQALERRNGTQIVLLTVPNAGPAGIEAYAREVVQRWDIGNNGQNNGVLFLVTHDNWYLATGAGITGAIPDVTLARISRDVMKPAWMGDEVSLGIEKTIDALVSASQAEETMGTAYDYSVAYEPVTPAQWGAMLLGALALVYGGTMLWQRRRRRARTTA